jgi:Right handed beta helix region/Protein of unknown function (DUF1565)
MPRLLLVSALIVCSGSLCSQGLPSGGRDAQGGLASALPKPMSPSRGRTYYVSRNGRDRNRGTRNHPWRTIQKALNTLKPGQKAFVRRGIYSANLLMSRHGRASAPITIAAYPHERVVLRPGSGGDSYPITIDSGAYFRLHGFTIERASGISSANVYITGTANHVELSGNIIRYGQNNGVLTDSTTSHVYILGNRIYDNGSQQTQDAGYQSHGIYLEGANDLVANNVIYDHPYGFGLQIYPVNHQTVVVDNTIVASDHSAIVLGADDTGDISDIIIRNNILYGDNFGIEQYANCPLGSVADHNLVFAYHEAPIMGGCGSGLSTHGGNFFANPLFVNYTGHNFKIRSGSPANDRASVAYSERTDFAGRPRPQGAGPDIGAYER